jgi:hypothetical protein
MIKNVGIVMIAFSLSLFSCKKVERPNDAVPSQTTQSAAVQNEKHDDHATEAPMETIKTNPNGKFATMDFVKTSHDFGKIKADEKVETIFEFVNNGKADLIITNAVGSCGCTVPEYPKVPVKIGQKGNIKVSFDSAKKSGAQSKSVSITANTPNGMELLEIKAEILPKN